MIDSEMQEAIASTFDATTVGGNNEPDCSMIKLESHANMIVIGEQETIIVVLGLMLRFEHL